MDYQNLILKKINGEISPKEEVSLNRWLNENPQNYEKYSEMVALWNDIDVPQTEDNQAGRNWLKIKAQINSQPEVKPVSFFGTIFRNFYHSRHAYRPVAISAVAVCILILGLMIWKDGFNYTKLSTKNRQTRKIELNDGSAICLNSASSVRCRKTFSSDVRKVHLQGEAYFDVEKDRRPFVVYTDNAKVTVLGTRFNIRNRKNKTLVSVKTGKVSFSPVEVTKEELILSAGEQGYIDQYNRIQAKQFVNSYDIAAWMNKRLIFNQTPLFEVVEELNRYYDVDIVIKNKKLGQSLLTAEFKDQKIVMILEYICRAFNAQYKRELNQYNIQ